jgi:hypothetical protein
LQESATRLILPLGASFTLADCPALFISLAP